MRKTTILSFAVFVAFTFAMTAFAFAGEKTAVNTDRKVKKIEEKGAFLGIYMEDLDQEMIKKFDYPKSTGVLVTGIVEDGPAEEAGLEENDVIYTIAGEKVKDSKELADLIGSKQPGDKIAIVAYRDGKKKKFDLALGERKTAYVTIDIDDYGDMANKAYFNTLGKGANVWVTPDGDHFSIYESRARLGVMLHELNADMAPYFKVKEGEGILVLSVVEDSPAGKAGMKAGDVIVKIGDAKISEIDDVYEALDGAYADIEEEGDEAEGEDAADMSVAVTVVRMGTQKVFEVELEDEFDMSREFIIRSPHKEGMKRIEMMGKPRIGEYRIQGMDQEKLEAKLKALEKEMQKLQKKLEEIDKND
jgi:C-terminal processing protease CtpA/Prc